MHDAGCSTCLVVALSLFVIWLQPFGRWKTTFQKRSMPVYIRVTTYGFDEARIGEALAKMDATIRDDLKAIAGLESVEECR